MKENMLLYVVRMNNLPTSNLQASTKIYLKYSNTSSCKVWVSLLKVEIIRAVEKKSWKGKGIL